MLCIFILICHVEALSRQTTDNDRFDEVFFTSKAIVCAKAIKRNNIKTTINGVFQ